MFLRKEHSFMIGRVHSIESFGTVDGPGIRMVIFLSGCPMRCLYCHNPDTWDPKGGSPMTAEEILDQYEQARPFYKKGGITVSGGEPLMQIGFVTELFEKAKKSGIHTCLCAQPQDNILAFAAYLEKKQIPVWIRHVVVPGITDREEYLYRLGRYLGTLKNVKALDVLPYHDMGKAKYGQLGIPYPLEDTAPLPPAKAAESRKIILQGMRDERVHCS